MSTYPVNFTGAFVDTVTVTNGTDTVTFSFTSIFTNVLTNGALDLVLTGTFGGDTAGDYLRARRPTCRLPAPRSSRAPQSVV